MLSEHQNSIFYGSWNDQRKIPKTVKICKFNGLIETVWIKITVAADVVNAALSNLILRYA